MVIEMHAVLGPGQEVLSESVEGGNFHGDDRFDENL